MRDRNLVAITGAAILAAVACLAQTHKIAPTPDSVVRAIGVYEWTGDLAKPTGSRFMPITVFIDGDLEDAGVYKPQPVPFALLSGNIYELEDAGLSKGNLVLESALHARMPEGVPGPAFDEGWTAYGSFKPPSLPKRAAPLKPSKTMPSIQVSGGNSSKPHLSDKSGDASASKGSGTGQQQQTKGDSTAGTKDTTASGSPDNDPDRPTMHRRTAPADDTASTGNSTTDTNDPAERPTLKRRSPEEEKAAKDQKNKKEVATVTEASSGYDDPDRPRLRHGSNKSEDNEPAKLMGVPKDMHQMVAVSDAKNRDAHVFARPWEDMNERAGVLTQMQAFARAKLAEYGTVPGVTPPSAIAGSATTPSTGTTTTPGVAADTGPPTLKRGIPSKASVTTKTPTSPPVATTPATGTTTPSPGTAPDTGPPTLKRGIPSKASVTTKEPAAPPAAATPPPSQASKKATPSHTAAKSHRKTAAAPQQVTLADEDLRGYTLSYGGAPTYVYQAHTVETGSVMRYITVVAQDNGMGQLKIALANVTDAAHLDRTPWMRLVDAVDVEASNRASLLFELRGQSSRQFALYRIIATKPEQIFVTGGAT